MGIVENVDYTITFKMLTNDTKRVISRSNVRSGNDPSAPNLRLDFLGGIPMEWEIFFNKDLTPAEGLLEIGNIIYSWDDEEIVAIQQLLNWLRAANCKERQTQRSRTDTPVTANWIPTFPNGEEINWAMKRLSRIFGTHYTVNGNMGIDRSRTSTNDDNRKRKYSETDHTAKAIAAIMEHMGMSKQKETPILR